MMTAGQKIKMYYDPRGNVIRTVNPDASEQWVIHGKPNSHESVAINNSWSFKNCAPTPWESYTYDANDLASKTGLSVSGHQNTPNSVVVDTLGRNVKTTAWLLNGDKNEFKYQYDIQGSVILVTDALNRNIFINKVDLRKQVLATEHLDAGLQTSVFDVASKPIETSDQKGAATLSFYDSISRPQSTFAKDGTVDNFTIRRYALYGDDAANGPANPSDNNYLGKVYKQYDESGMNEVLNYDFKGNITAKKKKVIKDSLILDAINDGASNSWVVAPYRTEWTLTPWNEETNSLEGDYQTDTAYDALNRATQITYPTDVNGISADRKTLTPVYNNAGLLEKVKLGDDEYVSHIAYNAKGQRLLIAYGNGVMTRCAYDKKTFRLKRYRTESFIQTSLQYASAGSVKEDRVYNYDLVGNVLNTKDSYTGCGLPANPDTLLKEFKYDELYRLLEATGREYDSSPTNPWDDITPSADPNATTFYRRIFSYDKMGNTQTMQHVGNSGFTRNFTYNNNRLNQLTVGSDTYDYVYDSNGNLVKEFSNRFFEWDFADKLRCFYNQSSSGSEPTIYEQYLYDAAGTRIKKLTRKPSGVFEVTVYIDGIFEYHKKVNGTTQEKNYIHVMDDKKRIAEVRIESFSDDDNKPIKYLLEDHLQSVSARLDENGTVIDREEFYAYGESSVTTFTKKRFRFTGKERDSYSGLYYYGARYYSCWTATFLSVDPAHAKTYTYSPYVYGNCNPVVFNDPSGMTGENQTAGVPPPRTNGNSGSGGSQGNGAIQFNPNDQRTVSNEDLKNNVGIKPLPMPTKEAKTGGPKPVASNAPVNQAAKTPELKQGQAKPKPEESNLSNAVKTVKDFASKGVEKGKETFSGLFNQASESLNKVENMASSYKVEFKTTFGAQAGLEGEVANRKVGGEFSVASLTILKLSYEQQQSDSGPEKFDCFLIAGKTEKGKNYVEVNQSLSGGVGIVSGGIQREFQGKSYGYENLTDEYSGAVGPVSGTVKKDESGNIVETKANAIYGRISFLVGFEFKVSIGKTSEIIKR